MFMKDWVCFLFLDPQNEIGPSISSSVVLCSFVLLIYIVTLVLVFYLCPSSVRVVATFPGTVLIPLLHSVFPFSPNALALSSFVIQRRCLKNFNCAASKRCSSLFFSTQASLPNFNAALAVMLWILNFVSLFICFPKCLLIAPFILLYVCNLSSKSLFLFWYTVLQVLKIYYLFNNIVIYHNSYPLYVVPPHCHCWFYCRNVIRCTDPWTSNSHSFLILSQDCTLDSVGVLSSQCTRVSCFLSLSRIRTLHWNSVAFAVYCHISGIHHILDEFFCSLFVIAPYPFLSVFLSQLLSPRNHLQTCSVRRCTQITRSRRRIPQIISHWA